MEYALYISQYTNGTFNWDHIRKMGIDEVLFLNKRGAEYLKKFKGMETK